MKTRRLCGLSFCLPARAVRVAALFVTSVAVAAPAPAAADSLAPDGAELTAGYGHDVQISGVAVHWGSLCTCSDLKTHGVDARLVAQVAYWRGLQRPTPYGSLWDTSVTPVLRWSAPDVAGARWFVEGGVGAHVLSATRINNDRILSTAFQFGETGGAGLAFGDRHRYEFGMYVQHVSNARLKEPNNGLTYFGAALRAALP